MFAQRFNYKFASDKHFENFVKFQTYVIKYAAELQNQLKTHNSHRFIFRLDGREDIKKAKKYEDILCHLGNPKKWKHWENGPVSVGDKNLGGIVLKKGSAPSDAILELYSSKQAIYYDCVTTYAIAVHRAYLELIGKAQYDKQFKDLTIAGDWGYSGPPTGKDKLRPIAIVYRNELPISGVLFTCTNPDARDNTGFRHENTILLGRKDGTLHCYGHPFGILSQEKIIEALLKENKGKGNPKFNYGRHRWIDPKGIPAK